MISAERLILHSRIAAEPQTSSTAVAPAERDGMQRADGEAQGDGDEEERVYTRADVEAAVQSLAELLPGSVPTPRLQPPEVLSLRSRWWRVRQTHSTFAADSLRVATRI